MDEILRLSHISKTFPGVRALDDISFDLKRGEVHCLCGENGAGKSTLIKILSGAYQPDEGGQIFFNGEAASLTPRSALSMGIHTIYQEHIVFNDLNITENIFAGSEIARRGLMQRKEMRRQTENVLSYLKSDLQPDVRMSRSDERSAEDRGNRQGAGVQEQRHHSRRADGVVLIERD